MKNMIDHSGDNFSRVALVDGRSILAHKQSLQRSQLGVGLLLQLDDSAARFTQSAPPLMVLRVEDGDRISQPSLRGGDQLQVELCEVGPRPVDFGQPLAYPLLAGRREPVASALSCRG
jgi:hypothetical protein